ncbi:MAG: hypothetical protein BWY17_04035 [Deltaproteobacteria bacterium ADurb.Bin207]|nr:MAG: hypothetical protein BWY17_04035 [Deltaproteobacteria bacterium ADurb.Bin207]
MLYLGAGDARDTFTNGSRGHAMHPIGDFFGGSNSHGFFDRVDHFERRVEAPGRIRSKSL